MTTTPRELTVLQAVANKAPDPVPVRQLAGLVGLDPAWARQLANYLTGRQLLAKNRAGYGRAVDYQITEAGRRELSGNG